MGGPEGHKHNPHVCDNMHPQYPIIMLDLLYMVYAKIRYVVYENRAGDRGALLVFNAYKFVLNKGPVIKGQWFYFSMI